MWKRRAFGATGIVAVAMAACSTKNDTTTPPDGGADPDGGTSLQDASVLPDAEVPALSCLRTSPNKDEYRPPFSQSGACSPAQLAEFQQCFGGDRDRCEAFTDAAENVGCVDGCLLAFDPNEAHYGAVVVDRRLNEPGYFELNGISHPCVLAAWDAFICHGLACIDCNDPDVAACQSILSDKAQSPCVEFDQQETAACQGEADKVRRLRDDFKTHDGVAKVVASFCGPP